MSGTMQGLGATGTGYGGNNSNSLLMQLLLSHLMSGGSTGSTGGMGTSIANNPMSGVLQAQRAQGMNPTAQMPQTGLQGASGGSSSMGGGDLNSLIMALQQSSKQTGGAANPYGTATNPNLLQGIGNLFSSGSWNPGSPTTLQNQMGLQSNQYVP